jgi:transcriptional regulator of nitric oxide reductase
MKAFTLLLSATVLLVLTMPVTSASTWTGRIVKAGWECYLVSEGRYYLVKNEDAHPELATLGQHTVRVTGTAVKDALTILTVEPIEPDAQLKQLFPSAAVFSRKNGYYYAYAADPRANPSTPPLGFAFWTTDVVPDERGFKGPIMMLVGMNTAGILSGIIVDYDTDAYGSFSIETPEFAAQFKGKSIRDPFTVGVDIDAVSRASTSVASATRAIKESARIVARQLLTPSMVK